VPHQAHFVRSSGKVFPGRQVDIPFQLVKDPVDPLIDPPLEHAVDIKRSVEPAQGPQIVVKARRVTAGEGLLIRREEEQPLRVKFGHVVMNQVRPRSGFSF